MGEVYLAQDTKLDRKVALKILPAEVASSRDRMERFVREAKSAAALNHPNIAHIYEIGEDAGTHYIAMEFIDGVTLREKIQRDKPPLTKLLSYLHQVAVGLAKAHGAGIVHRDLKPDNIMITRDDYAKVLDFGLAKLVQPQRGFALSDSGSSDVVTAVMQHSTPGMVLGTIGYMSPEQASGRVNEIDHRSDIFSFGCILFEAATGKRAFEGKDALDSLHKIVHAPTPQVKDANPLAPAELQRVVRRCLAKEPEKRYQSIKEVAIEIEELQQDLKQLKSADYSVSEAPTTIATSSGASRGDEGFWVAVLPFKYRGSNVDLEALAEGLSEDIVTGLARFSYLRVISRTSTLRFTSASADIRGIGKELGARYVMEGSLRQAGSAVRVTVQLLDATTGAHLWAETYDRQFQPDQIFAIQDELIPRIVSTCADHFGVLARSISDAVRGKDVGELSAYEALMRGFGYHHRLTPDEHAQARDALEKATAEAPANADCWAMLSWIYSHEYAHGYNTRPGSLDRALAAARRAVDLAPSNHLAYQTLAVALFFRKETAGCLSAAERSMALNPLDASNESIFLITFSGDWERGCSLIRKAMELNPHHPGWYRLVLGINEYRKANYQAAVDETIKANARSIFWTDLMLAAAYGQLADPEFARNALGNLLKEKPDMAESAQEMLGRWFQADLVDQLIDGLRKAGLKVISKKQTADTSSLATTGGSSGVATFEGRPAIAVLPFENRSDDREQEYFADGLAEDLITRLSLWRSFPVIARNSSFVYTGNAVDLKKVSAELGVRYVVQGSVRKTNNQVRISAQLSDSITGQHVWAKTYDRELIDVFAVQDEISEAIATSLVGDLERAEHARVQRRAPESLEAWGLYQRSIPLIYNFTREDCAQARSLLERAVARDPHFATALARLAEVGVWEVMYEWTDDPVRTLDIAIAQARHAVALDALDAQARISLSFALMTAGDRHGALEESRHAVELNPSMPFALAIHAYHWHIAGHSPEESIAFVQRALRLSPHDPVEWLFYDVIASAYLNAERFAEGFDAGRRLIALSPNYYWGYLWSAMNAAGLGNIAEARKLVEEARRVKPELSLALALKCLGTMAPDVDRRFTEALRLSGLESKREEPTVPSKASSGSSHDSLGSPIKTIAVLPFQNLSGDPEQEYFADGITEEIINALAQISGLRVAGRSSAFSFKGRNEDLRSVGAKLNVATILEGTLRRSGDRLRITAQLIDTGSGYQLWSERYDRVMAEIFALQDEIATTIAGRLQLSLSGTGEVQQPPTRHMGAYELYLKGRGLLYQRGLSIPKAIDCFTQAVALDPHYAQAWAGLADGYTTSGYSGLKRPEEVMPRALEAARRALELDRDLAEAHNALANATLLYERKFDVAEREFKQALDLNPNYPQAHAWYGLFYLHWIAGREAEARDELLRLLQIDPLSSYANVILAFSDFTSGRLSEAVDHSRRGVELDPNSYLAQWCHSAALKCNAHYAEAAVAAERALMLSGRHCWALATLTSIYAAWGKLEDARTAYRELEARSRREYIQPSMLLEAAAAVGEVDRAIAFAQRGFDERDPLLVLLIRSWPGYDPLRTNSRFLTIVSQFELPGWSTTVD